MNHNVTQGVRGPLARIGRRVAAIVAECNYAQTPGDRLAERPRRVYALGELAPTQGRNPDPDLEHAPADQPQPAGPTPGRRAWVFAAERSSRSTPSGSPWPQELVRAVRGREPRPTAARTCSRIVGKPSHPPLAGMGRSA